MADRISVRILPIVALVAVAGVVGYLIAGSSTSGDSAEVTAPIERENSTVEVERRDLVEFETLSGTLGFGDPEPFPTKSTGVVTWLPEEGAVIGFGERLFDIDAQPVLLLEGSIPAYRRLGLTTVVETAAGPGGAVTTSESSETIGPGTDVLQLEEALVLAGVADRWGIEPDEDFLDGTRRAIESWQTDLGIEATGVFELGQIAFWSEPVRIARINVGLGQLVGAQQAVVDITGTDRQVFVDLDAGDRAKVETDDRVEVDLPDDTRVSGTISHVSNVATAAASVGNQAAADPTIDVVVTLDDTGDARFDQAPVDVLITRNSAADALVVPVASLLALAEGGHAVEVQRDGEMALVGVELGLFVDSSVEVLGDLNVGDLVVVPG